MFKKIFTFASSRELDEAYRKEALKACREWIPKLEKSVEHSVELIDSYVASVNNRSRPLNTQHFLLIFWERRQLLRKKRLLDFFRDQQDRLLDKDRQLILTLDQYREEQARANPAIN